MAAVVLKGKEEIDKYKNQLDSNEIRNPEEALSHEFFLISALGEEYLVVGSPDYRNAVGSLKTNLRTSSVIVDSILGEKTKVGEKELAVVNQGINPEAAETYKKTRKEKPSSRKEIITEMTISDILNI